MNRNPLQYAVVFGMAMLLAAPAPQTQDPQDPEKRRSQGFVLKAGEHSLLEVIRSAAQFLGRNHLVTEADFASSPTVTLDKTLNLDAFGCEEVVSQLAYTRGFTMTPVDAKRGIYEFISGRGPRRPDIYTRAAFVKPEDVLRRPALKTVVATAVQLEHSNAARVIQTMRPFLAGVGTTVGPLVVGGGGNNRTVLLTGFADQVGAALRMLREVDEASKAAPDVLDRLDKIEMRLRTLERRLPPAKK